MTLACLSSSARPLRMRTVGPHPRLLHRPPYWQFGNLKEAIRVVQLNDPLAGKYSFV